MLRNKYFMLIFMISAIIFAYIVYTPVPEGLTQPYKYRLFVAGSNVMESGISFQNIFWPDEPNDMLTIRFLESWFIRMHSLIPGSKFRANETELDGVKVRLYQPIYETSNLMSGFIYIHGGGYCIGSTKVYDKLTRQFADELEAVVVSIEYRLSPEHVFPIPFEDTLKAAKWFISHAKDYGVDPTRIGIGGDSAGGALAALVTQHLHDDNSVPDPKVQVLVYPFFSAFDSQTPSFQKCKLIFGRRHGILPLSRVSRFLSYLLLGKADADFEEAYFKNVHTSSEFKKSMRMRQLNHSIIPADLKDSSFYSGPTDQSLGDDEVWGRIKDVFLDQRFSPFVRDDFSGLPEAYIQTCEFDCIRDNGIFYHNALKTAGVKSTWVNYKSGFHGVFSLDDQFDLGILMRRDAIEFAKSRLNVKQ